MTHWQWFIRKIHNKEILSNRESPKSGIIDHPPLDSGTYIAFRTREEHLPPAQVGEECVKASRRGTSTAHS